MKGNVEVVNRNPEMGLFHFVTGFVVGGYTGLYLAKNYRITGDNLIYLEANLNVRVQN